MRIYANINERTVGRKFTEPKHRKRPLTIIDHTLPAFSLKINGDDTRTFFVRVKRRLGVDKLRLGTAAELTADEARAMALAEIEAAEAERKTGPLFRYFADEFMRRQGPRWKLATRESNRSALRNHILPFFGDMRVADIARADVQRWFDSMSAAPARANRALPVLSVMMTRAELWDLRPQGSNPCRNMRRYRTKPRERFLSLDELKRLGFVLDHAEDRQAAAAVRLLLFTGARSSEITGLRWDWIRDTRAVLPDSKSGPKTIQLPPPARAVLHALPRRSRFVFPDAQGTAPMADLGRRWLKLRALAGLDGVRIHDCRHSFASHAVMSGLDLYTVGRLLGHADIASTERYAHLADDHIGEMAGRISGIVGAAMTGDRKREG
ncbi:MAG: site-specific integrase [Rhodospirillaceae bacterium]|nr:site-specific integrase [Rhodospirillaceae bacterium]MYF86479.1 site-specific integrase [Rhodospirillaceae bacterium]MYH38153.1 site-specific integrase [Rhodospirillaceae bacterium]MYK16136.1 site-specific integrase [Rhodospirillaceae bacterium]MYK58635.1 site-specific integrase [Rhodospirillaceae bacterium]